MQQQQEIKTQTNAASEPLMQRYESLLSLPSEQLLGNLEKTFLRQSYDRRIWLQPLSQECLKKVDATIKTRYIQQGYEQRFLSVLMERTYMSASIIKKNPHVLPRLCERIRADIKQEIELQEQFKGWASYARWGVLGSVSGQAMGWIDLMEALKMDVAAPDIYKENAASIIRQHGFNSEEEKLCALHRLLKMGVPVDGEELSTQTMRIGIEAMNIGAVGMLVDWAHENALSVRWQYYLTMVEEQQQAPYHAGNSAIQEIFASMHERLGSGWAREQLSDVVGKKSATVRAGNVRL